MFDEVPVDHVVLEIDAAIRDLELRPELGDVDLLADVRGLETWRHLVIGRDLLQVLRRYRGAGPEWHGSTLLRLTLNRTAELLRFTPPRRPAPE